MHTLDYAYVAEFCGNHDNNRKKLLIMSNCTYCHSVFKSLEKLNMYFNFRKFPYFGLDDDHRHLVHLVQICCTWEREKPSLREKPILYGGLESVPDMKPFLKRFYNFIIIWFELACIVSCNHSPGN